jgi:hypothetical protein
MSITSEIGKMEDIEGGASSDRETIIDFPGFESGPVAMITTEAYSPSEHRGKHRKDYFG